MDKKVPSYHNGFYGRLRGADNYNKALKNDYIILSAKCYLRRERIYIFVDYGLIGIIIISNR
jgi:hypothetical protein